MIDPTVKGPGGNSAARRTHGCIPAGGRGGDDGLSKRGTACAYDRAPANPKSLYKVIGGGHKGAPTQGKDEIVAWLKTL